MNITAYGALLNIANKNDQSFVRDIFFFVASYTCMFPVLCIVFSETDESVGNF